MNALVVTVDDETYQVLVTPLEGQPAENCAPGAALARLAVQIDDRPAQVIIPPAGAPGGEIDWVIVDGRPYEIGFDHYRQWVEETRLGHAAQRRSPAALVELAPPAIQVRAPEMFITRPISKDGLVSAPIPGRVVSVLVSAGQSVVAGQPLVILEAMKMENEIRAVCAGMVQAVHAHPGQCVKRGEKLVEIG